MSINGGADLSRRPRSVSIIPINGVTRKKKTELTKEKYCVSFTVMTAVCSSEHADDLEPLVELLAVTYVEKWSPRQQKRPFNNIPEP